DLSVTTFEQTARLNESLARQYDARTNLDSSNLAFDQRQPMTIGGHHPNVILLHALEEYTAQAETRLVRGHREQGLFDHLAEGFAREVHDDGTLLRGRRRSGDARKILRINRK